MEIKKVKDLGWLKAVETTEGQYVVSNNKYAKVPRHFNFRFDRYGKYVLAEYVECNKRFSKKLEEKTCFKDIQELINEVVEECYLVETTLRGYRVKRENFGVDRFLPPLIHACSNGAIYYRDPFTSKKKHLGMETSEFTFLKAKEASAINMELVDKTRWKKRKTLPKVLPIKGSLFESIKEI